MRRVPMVCVGGGVDGERWMVEAEERRVVRVPGPGARLADIDLSAENTTISATYFEYEVTAIHTMRAGEKISFHYLKPRNEDHSHSIERLLQRYPGDNTSGGVIG